MLFGIWDTLHLQLYLYHQRDIHYKIKLELFLLRKQFLQILICLLLTLIIITIINPLMRPTKKTEINEIDSNFKFSSKKSDFYELNKSNRNFAQIVENNRLISIFIGIFFIILYFLYFLSKRVLFRSKFSELVIFRCRINLINFINSLCKVGE